ncbi:MAG: hypothetical protein HY751_04730 [Nitrospinae bacterium]|nr:hypothetical protein [Nitrospinota bacterium]
MKDTIKFDILYGRCQKCDGPVFFTQTIDWDGNRVNSLQCWNGHYESIQVAEFEFVDEKNLTREQIESILPFVGFVRLDGEA